MAVVEEGDIFAESCTVERVTDVKAGQKNRAKKIEIRRKDKRELEGVPVSKGRI